MFPDLAVRPLQMCFMRMHDSRKIRSLEPYLVAIDHASPGKQKNASTAMYVQHETVRIRSEAISGFLFARSLDHGVFCSIVVFVVLYMYLYFVIFYI